MLLHQLSCPKVRLLLSVLMLKDACRNYYAVSGVNKVVSHESRHLADDGHTKPSSSSCATFWESLTPSYRRTATYIALAYLLKLEGGTGRPRLKLINVPSVKG